VQSIFDNLFEEGKKRGYSKYRSHVNTMGTYWVFLVITTNLQLLTSIQIVSPRYTTSTTTRIGGLLRRSKMLLILTAYFRRGSRVSGQSGSEEMRFQRRIYELQCRLECWRGRNVLEY
jgi:hypothetical protein